MTIVKIRSELWVSFLLFPLAYLLIFLAIIISNPSTPYMFFLLALIVYFIYDCIKVATHIKKVILNIDEKRMKVHNRIFIFSFLIRPQEIKASEIRYFLIKESNEIILTGTRYFIEAFLKSNETVILIQTTNKIRVNKIKKILDNFIFISSQPIG